MKLHSAISVSTSDWVWLSDLFDCQSQVSSFMPCATSYLKQMALKALSISSILISPSPSCPLHRRVLLGDWASANANAPGGREGGACVLGPGDDDDDEILEDVGVDGGWAKRGHVRLLLLCSLWRCE